jgi:hypothetical protein
VVLLLKRIMQLLLLSGHRSGCCCYCNRILTAVKMVTSMRCTRNTAHKFASGHSRHTCPAHTLALTA